MKIVELRAENVKRLKAVEITPDGTLQVIGGRNAQGKSSVLDAIWLALGGGAAGRETVRPIRDGEDRASVTLDLGDLIVTRTWTQKGTALKVSSADGATYSSPQKMLDELVGRLSFDPLAFTRLSPREQRDALLRLVDLDVDLDQLRSERDRLFADRTEVGRRGKAIGDVAVDDTLPTEETSAGAYVRMIQARQERNREIESAREWAASHETAIKDVVSHIQRLQSELAELRETQKKALERVRFLGDPEPIDELEEQLRLVEDTNAAIRVNNAARQQMEAKGALRREYEALTAEIAALDARKAQALAAAAFPVNGLGFDDDGVTYRGVPLSQASSAEQIRVSLAVGMALNPRLRVLMIKDGSLLDDESMAAIKQQVSEHDFQLWIERVGDSDEGAVIIEDGQVTS